MLRDLPDPTCPDGGILVRVAATGVCRSDWHAWLGHDPVPLPMVPGHEFAGVVDGEPRLLGDHTWVVHLREMESRYATMSLARILAVGVGRTACSIRRVRITVLRCRTLQP